MPQLGDIKYGKEIGYKRNNRFIWGACERCKKVRWVQFIHGKARWNYCRKCSSIANNYFNRGERHYNWKGGIAKDKNGYLVQRIHRDDPFASMLCNRKNNTIGQHRLVMAKYLGRCLESYEHVHHINGIKTDNRIENLALTNTNEHTKNTLKPILMTRIRELENRIHELENKYIDTNELQTP